MDEKVELKADSVFQASLERTSKFLSRNWLRLVALVATGVLTGSAAWSLTQNWFYTACLVMLAEGASLFWTARASDNGNKTQDWLSYVGAAVAWISIIATDLASATILAKGADAEIFAIFQRVPEWAQNVVTYILPTLAVTHGVLGTAHHYFSEEAKLARDLAKIHRDAERDVEKARAEAEKNIAQAQANRFKQLAEESAEGIGIERGTAMWRKSYKNVVTPEQQSNDNIHDVTTIPEVGQSVPFPANGNSKKPTR